MLSIDLKARLKNKTFWVTIIGAVILLAEQLGFDASKIIPSNYVDIINTVFMILTIVGITVDTSTTGISDNVVAVTTTEGILQAEEIRTSSSITAINDTVTSISDGNKGVDNPEATTNTTRSNIPQ